MPLRIAVVDDEPVARERVARLLEDTGEAAVVAQCGGGEEAVEAIETLAPDLVYLDVQMPEMDGFGVIEAVGPKRMPAVVFVTAYDRFALQAFEVHALDYLLKPFSEGRFHESFRHARQVLRGEGLGGHLEQVASLVASLREKEGQAGSAPGAGRLDQFLVKHRDRFFFLPAAEVDWLSAEGNYVSLHSKRGSFLVRASLGGLEDRLDPAQFVRIHRSTIVRADRIKEIRPWFSGDYVVHLLDGTELKLSRRFSERLFQRGQ